MITTFHTSNDPLKIADRASGALDEKRLERAIPMKILTIFATASALALSTATAFAGHAGDDKQQLTRDFYATAASGQTGGYVHVSDDQNVRPAPVDPENAVRGSIYRVSRHNDRAIARAERRDAVPMAYRSERDMSDTTHVRDDRPYGPKYQPQEQVQHSVYDVVEGKKGDTDEYYWR